MPLDSRDYLRGEHPPTCTCVACERARLAKRRKAPPANVSFAHEYVGPVGERRHRPRPSVMVSWAFLLILLLTIATVALIVYVTSRFSEIDQTAAMAIIGVAGIAMLWQISALRRLCKLGPRAASPITVLACLMLVATLASTAAAFNGISPFSDARDRLSDLFKGADVATRIDLTGVNNRGDYWRIPVELTPSDSVELHEVSCIELVSSEGYLFGRHLVYWAESDSRWVKTITFSIPASDKVATRIAKLHDEMWTKSLSGEPADEVEKWYESNLNRLLEVNVMKIDLVTMANISAQPASADSYLVTVELAPSTFVEPEKAYEVRLCWIEDEETKWLSASLSWTQEHLDVRLVRSASFGNVSRQFWESHTFTARVLPYS